MYQRIVVPVDGSSLAEHAIPFAADLAHRAAGRIRVVRVHVPVVPLMPPSDMGALFYDPAWDRDARAMEQKYLSDLVARLRAEGRSPVDGALLDGVDIAAAIEEDAALWDASLIVTTTHGHGGAALAWLGSVASGVVRNARRPVLVIPEKAGTAPPEIRRILVAHDGTPTSDAVIEPAVAMARTYGAAVTLVRVVAPPLVGDVWSALSSEGLDRFGVDKSAERAKEQLDEIGRAFTKAGLNVSATVIVNTNPARALIDEIARVNADVVAMSTAGRGLSRLIVGSVADKVLRSCDRPVLIRRPRETPPAE